MKTKDAEKKESWFGRLTTRLNNFYDFCVSGVWNTSRQNWKIDLIKTVNLSVTSILNKDVQSTAYAMAYRTLLATVPALALLFAIGRGFGFTNILKTSLFTYFPAQKDAIEKSLEFVDSYLNQASEGVFVGIGLVFLLWTLISLLSAAETAFNKIWGVTQGRTLWRQVADYTAICLILPVLMICSTGINIFMSSTIQTRMPAGILSPIVGAILDSAGVILTWAFFTGVYKLMPNTRVRFKNALIAGILAGTAFVILQFLFVSGQIYVSKYNAIYGSFAFLPLLMIWLQFVWLITLAGGVVCYSSQNIFRFSFSSQISNISLDYQRKILLAVMSVIVQAYNSGNKPPTQLVLARVFRFPMTLLTSILQELQDAHLIFTVEPADPDSQPGYVPALPVESLTVGEVLKRLRETGSSGFLPGFHEHFPGIDEMLRQLNTVYYNSADKFLLADLKIQLDNPTLNITK